MSPTLRHAGPTRTVVATCAAAALLLGAAACGNDGDGNDANPAGGTYQQGGGPQPAQGGPDGRMPGANGKVVAETMLGAVDVAGRLSGACRLHSGNGTVTVTLPADSRLKIKASTGTGAITNAFGLPVEGFGPRTCSGKIGDGSGGSLRVETMVGAISLNKP